VSLYFDDYEGLDIGHTWRTGQHLVTMEDIETFARLTGDTHPQHIDPEYGRNSPYGALIGHGFLTVSIASGLVYRLGLDRDSAHAILDMSWRLPNPVLVGDALSVEVTLLDRRASGSKPDFGIVRRRYDVTTQGGTTVAMGEVVFMIRRRPPPR
jgi:Acyl dehydratase